VRYDADRMTRRRLLEVAIASVVAAPIAARAQPAAKSARVAYVAPTQGPTDVTAVFRQTLADAGYIEGRNLVIEYRWMAGREAEYPAVFAALRGAISSSFSAI